MSYYHYDNLTGDLIIINQLEPFTIKGNLLTKPILDSVKILDGIAIFESGIKFPNLLTELSSYFTKWTITINIYSNSEGELWNSIPIILFIQGDNILYEFNTTTDYYNIDYTLNNYNIKNYLYRGHNATYANNDENKNYITYEQKTNRITLRVNISEYKGELQLIHDFLNTDYPSGDIIIKSPEGTMRDTYIKNIIISTTDTYTGDSLYYEIEDIYYENNNLLNILYHSMDQYTNILNYINFNIQDINYSTDKLMIINFIYTYLFPKLTNTFIFINYPDSLEFPGFVKADKTDLIEIYDDNNIGFGDVNNNNNKLILQLNYPDSLVFPGIVKADKTELIEIYDSSNIEPKFNFPKLTDSILRIDYPDSLEFPGIVKVNNQNNIEIYDNSPITDVNNNENINNSQIVFCDLLLDYPYFTNNFNLVKIEKNAQVIIATEINGIEIIQNNNNINYPEKTENNIYMNYPNLSDIPNIIEINKNNIEIYDDKELQLINYPEKTENNIYMNYPNSSDISNIIEINKNNIEIYDESI